jgi:hypothetical protein
VSWFDSLALFAAGTGSSLIASAVGAGLAYVATVFLSRRTAAKAARAAGEDLNFEFAMQSGDLELVGDYLRESLGRIPLKDFLLDDIAGERLDICLRRLSSEVNQPQPPEPERPPTGRVRSGEKRITPESKGLAPGTLSDHGRSTLLEARQRLGEGLVWDAMTLLRMEVERAVYERAPDAPYPLKPDVFRHAPMQAALGIFLRTANRCIHGETVTVDEAKRAANAAQYVLARISKEFPVPTSRQSVPR